MKNLTYIGIIFFCIQYLLFKPSPLLLGQVTEFKGEGILRITFQDWKYAPAPYTVGSIERLGETYGYFIFIYSTKLIKDMINTNNRSKELTGSSGKIATDRADRMGSIAPQEARILFTPENHEKMINLFNNGDGLRILIEKPRPPYVDIPLTPGKYFLAYVVVFPYSQNEKYYCPFYADKSCINNKSWGPGSVLIVEDQIELVDFAPGPQCWDFTIDLKEWNLRWEQSPQFWEYIDFLLWSGAIY